MYGINEILADIRNQFESGNDFTNYGEPQAWICLENGRAIELDYEEDNVLPDVHFFRVSLHCTDDEFDNNQYNEIGGIIASACSYDVSNILDVEAVKRPLEYILKVNESEKVMR